MKKFALVTSSLIIAAATAAAADGSAASYTADAAQSRLEFFGVQAGAEFKGVFHKFTSSVDFAPDALAGSKIDVQIDMNSVDSMDKDRDTTIRGKDVFDVAHNPTAHYVTKSITKTAA
ncbi:MAG TPA: YceI family protein, partial [Steroidobacteraceae bacterium]|nr:YceI family protein [Steroidobacteraceae bacterium]